MVATYLVSFVKIILSSPLKVRVISSLLVVSVETSKAFDVASAEPVGTDDVPNVPV